MEENIQGGMDANWWPISLPKIESVFQPKNNLIVVAEESMPWGEYSHLKLSTGLISTEKISEFIESASPMGYEVTTNTHPSISTTSEKEHVPFARINGGEIVPQGMEPLTLAWTSANYTTLSVDQGFLLTYGLTPRIEGEFIMWDDLSRPILAVVLCKPTSHYSFPKVEPAYIAINKNYLQDYSTIRKKALVQVYYVERWTDLTNEARGFIETHETKFINLPARTIQLLKSPGDDRLLTGIWGRHILLSPSTSPITVGRWDHGTMAWPGLEKEITKDDALSGNFGRIFVSDKVLENYEGRSGFNIIPHLGAVSYGSQWGTSGNARVGRDLISINLKKIYEGIRPETTKLWNKYAVEPPVDISAEQKNLNIAIRTQRIVYQLLDCGDQLAALASNVIDRNVAATEVIELNREKLDYEGWWISPKIEKAARHLPLDINYDSFLDRALVLNALVVDSFQEKLLRSILLRLSVPDQKIKGYRSLKLLDYLIKMILLSKKAGLVLKSQAPEVLKRLEQQSSLDTEVEILVALNTLRIAKGHAIDHKKEREVDDALKTLGVSKNPRRTEWGEEGDLLYDSVYHSLTRITQHLSFDKEYP